MPIRNSSRREFLKTAAASGTAALVPASLVAAEDSKTRRAVSFGFSLYGMRKLPLETALQTCATIGYDAVELAAMKDWPGDPAKLSRERRRDLRKRLADLNLKLPALMENLRLVVDAKTHRANLDRLKRAAGLGRELSPDNPPVIETVLGGKPQQWEKLKDRMAERLRDWAKTAEAAKCVIAIKAHVGGALHTPQDAVWLMKSADSPSIRLAYDYSHFQLWGFDLADSLRAMIDHTAFIHVKDSKGQRGRFRFTLPGEGSIDYAKYFRLLKRYNYRGPICVEVSGQIHGRKDYDPAAAAKTSFANLAGKLKAAGLWG